MLFPMSLVLYFYISTFRSMCAVSIIIIIIIATWDNAGWLTLDYFEVEG
jgi:hypothetical protein